MKDPAVKIAQSHEREVAYQCTRDVAKELINNRLLMLLAVILIVEYFQSHVNEQGVRVAGGGWLGEVVGTLFEGTVATQYIAKDTLPEVAKMVESFSGALGDVTKALGPVIAAGA